MTYSVPARTFYRFVTSAQPAVRLTVPLPELTELLKVMTRPELLGASAACIGRYAWPNLARRRALSQRVASILCRLDAAGSGTICFSNSSRSPSGLTGTRGNRCGLFALTNVQ